jgi:DNA-binding GntR family transcriptional regulator
MANLGANRLIVVRKKVTVNERVYLEIKARIASRELPPGSPLVLRRLSADLGVSVTPVVEAIRRLERDGLVTVVPEAGATVKHWTRHEILEAFHIRRALERESARLFVLRASHEDKHRLAVLSDRFDRLAASDPFAADQADIDLHMHIVRSTGLPHLYEMIENSHVETTLLHGLAIARTDSEAEIASTYRASIGCHQPLVEALRGNDTEAAAAAMCRHMDSSFDLILGVDDKGAEFASGG